MAREIQNEDIAIENAELRFKNFSGKEGRFNAKGNRNFCVLLNPNDAYQLSDNTARMTARYMYNFLMNKYVQEKTEGKHKYFYTIGENKKIKYSLYKTDYFEELPIEE